MLQVVHKSDLLDFSPIDLLEKPKHTISLESVDEVTIMELKEGKHIKLCSVLEWENRCKVLEALKSRIPTFAWKLEDITNIDPTIITRKLNVDLSIKPVKQKKRKFTLERQRIITGKIQKLKEDRLNKRSNIQLG